MGGGVHGGPPLFRYAQAGENRRGRLADERTDDDQISKVYKTFVVPIFVAIKNGLSLF